MRLHSTEESIANEEVSIVALIETVVAISGVYLLYRYTGSLVYFAISATISPLLLLRTPFSNGLAIRFYNHSNDILKLSFFDSIIGIILSPLAILFALIVIFVAKFLATVVAIFRHPILTLSSIGSNWRRIVLCTDIFTAPEFFSSEGSDDPDAHTTIKSISQDFLETIRGDDLPHRSSVIGNLVGIIPKILISFIFMLIYFPALLYRLSIKSTAIVWSPLIFVFVPTSKKDDVVLYLKRVRKRSVYKFLRGYSLFIIALFSAKILFFYFQFPIQRLNVGDPGSAFIHSVIVPGVVPLWQIAAVINAVFAWVIFFAADYILQDIEDGAAGPGDIIQFLFMIGGMIRNTLSFYTSLCTLYIFATTVDPKRFPALGDKILPWAAP